MAAATAEAGACLKARAVKARLALLTLLIVLAGGCTPLLPLVTAALGGLDSGGSAGKSLATGPFAGARSPTQNSRATEPPVNDALAGLDQSIKASCQARLPPPEPDPTKGCAMRDMCLPGAERPTRMRVCAAISAEPVAALPQSARRTGAGAARHRLLPQQSHEHPSQPDIP